MIVRADDLRPEGLDVDLRLSLGPLEDPGGFGIDVEEVALTATIHPTRKGLNCSGRLATTAWVPCSRCLEPYALPLDRRFDVVYERPGAAAGEPGLDHQVPKDELDVSYLDAAGRLDLRELATEQIYLELPMKPLCSAECRGLCPACGANRNKEACRCSGGAVGLQPDGPAAD